jgi:mRNA-degrading endonuclease RelE of RelBE toxin-antitoxin system
VKLEFLERFDKDLDKIDDIPVRQAVLDLICEVEKARSLRDIKNLKKLRGHKYAYRIKIGNFRIGFYYENSVMEFARILHRKDIYKEFPGL